jgi:hypothetical protein
MATKSSKTTKPKFRLATYALPKAVVLAVIDGLKEAGAALTGGDPSKQVRVKISRDPAKDGLVVRFTLYCPKQR